MSRMTPQCGVAQTDGDGCSWPLSGIPAHLHCLQIIELQIDLAAPGPKMVNLPPVGTLIVQPYLTV